MSILLNDLTLNQLNYEVFSLAKKHDVDIFYLDQHKNDLDVHSSFSAVNLWSIWNNVVVCHTWQQAEFVSKLTTNTVKIFYIYDIDWHDQQMDYPEQIEILGKMDRILCRSPDHAKLIKSHFHIDPEVSETYSYNILMKDNK